MVADGNYTVTLSKFGHFFHAMLVVFPFSPHLVLSVLSQAYVATVAHLPEVSHLASFSRQKDSLAPKTSFSNETSKGDFGTCS